MPDNPADIEQPDGTGVASVPSGELGVGERLRSARKARAISLERVAEALHLDESVVLALEEERFDELGAPVFVRGHLKAYAKLVGLPLDNVLGAYHEPEPLDLAVPSTERRTNRSVTINPVVWGVSGLVVLLGLVLALYVMQGDETQTRTVATPAASPAVAEPDAVEAAKKPAAAVAAPAAEPEPVPEPIVAERAADVEPEPAQVTQSEVEPPPVEPVAEPETVAAPVPRPDLVRLSLNFREESWVEISDANERLLFGLQREGRRRELAGEPPFQLLIGNAQGVDLRINDELYLVPSSRVRGKVARFEIDAGAIP